MRRTNRKSEQGVSLLFALLALMVLTAVAVGMMYMSSTETAINSNFKAEETAYLAARAGVEEARDRMLPGNPNTINALLPTTTLPSTTGGVLYVKQTGVADADILNVSPTNPVGDDELCHDFPYGGSGFGQMTPTPLNVRCASLPGTGGWYTTTASVAPYALEYKWTRITLKANDSTPYVVDSNYVSNQVCWNGKSEVALAGAASCDKMPTIATPVYLVTALAVTPTGARRLVQQELAQAPPVNPPNDGFFATSSGCNALQVGGSAKTGSFNSATQSAPNPPNPPSNQSNTNGNVGANGGVFVNGSKTAVNGSITTNLPATIGACPANGITTSGGPTIGAPTPLPVPYIPPVPPLPNPLPPQTNVVYRNTTLNPGAYGNITLQGTIILNGGTPGNPAVYTINSLAMNGNANIVINGPVVFNIAGVGQTNPINMTGGSFTNNTYIPTNFTINYGGTGNVIVAGGSAAFAFINTPNAPIVFNGGSNFYGSAVGSTLNDLGGTSLYWDTSLQFPPPVNNSLFHEISLRELSY
jgi:hypothetical protein